MGEFDVFICNWVNPHAAIDKHLESEEILVLMYLTI